MPNYVNSVTIVAGDIEDAREKWTRLGFAVSADGDIALGSVRITLRETAEAGPGFSIATTERPDAPMPTAPHANGVRALAAIAGRYENPADHAQALGRLAGQREMRATSAGVEMNFANARMEALTRPAFAQRYDETGDGATRALVFAAPDLGETRAWLRSAGLAFDEKFGRLVLVERPAGYVLAFEAQ